MVGGALTASDVAAELARLAELHQSSILNDEEFAAAKRRVLEDRPPGMYTPGQAPAKFTPLALAGC